MAYNKPSVNVYQDLINAGGAQQLNPDLPACIIGTAKTVISADLSDELSKALSVGSIDESMQTNATFEAFPASGEVFINVDSAKPGQKVDKTSYSVWAENALVKNAEIKCSVVSGVATVTAFELPVGGELITPLPYNSNLMHVNLGDTVTDATGTQVAYISAINGSDLTLSDITVGGIQDSAEVVLSVFKKFDALEVVEYVEGTDGVIDISVNAGVVAGQTNLYTIKPEIEVEGAGSVMHLYVGYTADRADLSSKILVINDVTDLVNQLGEIVPTNELAFGVSLALANSGGTSVKAIALDPNLGGIAAHTKASELAEGSLIYMPIPLTTNVAYHGVYNSHVRAMSQPEVGKWRSVLTSVDLPTEEYIIPSVTPMVGDGADEDLIPDALMGGTVNGTTVKLARGETFGAAAAGHLIKVVSYAKDEYNETVYTYSDYTIEAVGGDTAVVSEAITETPEADGKVYFYIARTLSGTNSSDKQVQAEWVAAQASTWMHNRMWMFPGQVDIPVDGGVNARLPGYFLMCALGGFISGTPAQQPVTNISLAGISELVHGNFYFTQNQMNIMAQAGTILYEQEAQGTSPYCRHAITTDVSVLEYREILKVKNWDYLSYYYKSILEPFIGTWNITDDTIQNVRQTVVAASESLKQRKLPKIGAPLVDYNIATLEQSETSADSIDLYVDVAIVNPNNYVQTHLQI